jgi:penicillin-binding protein 2
MTESKTRARMKLIAGLVAFMFAALTTRLWYLQVLATDQFTQEASQNEIRTVPIEPLRGKILDRTGNVLVDNRPSTVILVDRLGMQDRGDEVLFRLSNLLHIPVSELLDRLGSVKYLPYQPVPVAEDVTKQQVFYIEEHRDLFPGVSYELKAVRNYPEGTTAAHLLGYVGEISSEQLKEKAFAGYQQGETVGKAGVEAVYEPYLHGVDGVRKIQVNAQGRVLDDDFGSLQPKAGDNLVLSIDEHVQQLSERSLALGLDAAHHVFDRTNGYLKATGGAVIVMDPRNGQVLAMASNPTYDPSVFLGGIGYRESQGLDLCFPGKPCPKPSHNNPLLDRAIQGLYPGGSTFKPFVAMSALRDLPNFATVNGHYDCPGVYFVPTDPTHRPFHNWEPASLGYLSIPEALVISCDTVFYQFGFQFWLKYRHTGQEVFQKDLSDMGFGRPTGVDLPGEQAGRVPTEQYMHQLYKEHPKVFGRYYGWLPGFSLNLAIGQGNLLLTPMQLAVAYSAIANGGRLFAPRLGLQVQTPDGRLVKRIPSEVTGRLPVSQSVIAYIRNALTGVPVSGTAAAAFAGFPLDRIPVAAKTGTADITGYQPFSWFAAMAPAGNPRYVVVALVEQGGHGSTTAAPVVRRILEGLFGIRTSNKLQAGNVVD